MQWAGNRGEVLGVASNGPRGQWATRGIISNMCSTGKTEMAATLQAIRAKAIGPPGQPYMAIKAQYSWIAGEMHKGDVCEQCNEHTTSMRGKILV